MQYKIIIPIFTLAFAAPILAQTENFPTDPSGGWMSLGVPRICRVVNFDDVVKCSKGDQLLYLPKKSTDESFVINAAAACDLRQPVIWNKAGVSCIYSGRRVIVDAAELK